MHRRKQRDKSLTSFRLTNRWPFPASLAALAFLVLVLFSPAQNAAQSGDQRPLTAGAPMTRELAGGQAHGYQLTLAAGQYLQVSVDQRGCDVAVALLGPDGALQAEADFDSDLRGQEILSWVTKAACDCKLEIRSKSKTAGRYVLKIEALREATPQDDGRVAAYRLHMEARRLHSTEIAETMRQAAGKYEAALTAWKNLGDQAGQAATLLDSGASTSIWPTRRKRSTPGINRSPSGARWGGRRKKQGRSAISPC